MKSANQTVLDGALADELELLAAGRKASIEGLALRAAELRTEFLSEKSNTYDPSFVAFWKRFGMSGRFGSLANFTKYAAAGTSLKTAKSIGDGRDKRYPGSLRALYEISLLTPEEIELCLANRVTRSELTDDKSKWDIPIPPSPLINPAVTASTIAGWRKAWRNPSSSDENAKGALVLEVRLQLASSSIQQKSDIPSQAQLDHLAEDFFKRISHLPGVELTDYSSTVLARAIKTSGTSKRRELSQLIRREKRRDTLEALMFPNQRQAKLKGAKFVAACRLVGVSTMKIDDNPGRSNSPSTADLQLLAHNMYEETFGVRELANCYYRMRQSYLQKDVQGNVLRGFEVNATRNEIIAIAKLARAAPDPQTVLDEYSGSLDDLALSLAEIPSEVSAMSDSEISALCQACLRMLTLEMPNPVDLD